MNKTRRLRFLLFILSLFFLFLTGRLLYLSLFQSSSSPEGIKGSKIPTNPLFRGDIYSLDKSILAVSLPFYSIFLDPSLIDHKKEKEYTNTLLAFGMTEPQIQDIFVSTKKFRWISRMLPKKTFFSLQKYLNLYLPGIVVKQEYKRVYPHNFLASSVLGFTDIDGKGIAGIEYSANNYLEPNIFSKTQKELLGYDVILTIQSKLQKEVEETISKVGEELSPDSISAIIMEASTGKILSMANYPTFNSNDYNNYKDPKIFINTSISHIDEPGSTFKPLIMAYLFDKNLITAASRFSSSGKEKIHGFTIKEAIPKSLGILSPQDILIHSSNIGMAKASQGLNKKELYNILDLLHLGHPTGILLPGEESGIVRSPNKMTERSRLAIPIGQEIGLTPLQLVSAFSSLANNGVQVFPYIVDHLEYEGKPLPLKDQKPLSPPVKIYSPQNADLMLQYMRQVVLRGSGRKANIPGEWVSAKTGTAQIFNFQKGAYSELNTSMISIYSDKKTHKKYIIYGVIRDPKVDSKIAWGGTLAAPMVKDFILELKKVLAETS